MRIINKALRIYPVIILLIFTGVNSNSQKPAIKFGKELVLKDITPGTAGKVLDLKWINVNTADDTWSKKKNLLICSGIPIGVMRSERQFENFLMHIEWKHIDPGGNSGVFVWSNAIPDKRSRLPNGVEVQMLELDWININIRRGVKPPVAYVHGELFGAGGTKTDPDNPRGDRSKSIENRCKGRGEWNTYDIVCVDGTIKLAVNGKFVNGISNSSQKKGYLCLESEGGQIHFRNIRIIELPPGVISSDQIVPELH